MLPLLTGGQKLKALAPAESASSEGARSRGLTMIPRRTLQHADKLRVAQFFSATSASAASHSNELEVFIFEEGGKSTDSTKT